MNYNEAKVRAGEAVCLEAGFYPMAAADLSFQQKLRRLEMLTELNQRTTVNSLHISLNFHPSEQFSDERLKELAEEFLDRIGFTGQPYLLYQHFDAGHPHVHLVTTNIKADGKAINLNNIGKDRARPACVAMEKAYGLVSTAGQKNDLTERFKPVNVQRALYGKMETKRAMNGIINVVAGSYNFTSLAQLNAVLGLYNIVADTGGEGSRVNRFEGLVFRVLDASGNKVGVPIKASDFYEKPTLKKLREKFKKNELKRDGLKKNLKTKIDLALLGGGKSLEKLVAELKGGAVDVVVRRGKDGVIYGMTYVDHKNKVVFNGSELGKAYSAKAVLERCQNIGAGEEKKQNGEAEKLGVGGYANAGKGRDPSREFVPGDGSAAGGRGLAEVLLDAGELREVMDWELKRKKKKKKRLRLSPG
ncbi:relaxase/mobilization nuclease domain-containing protein [Mucilaginibacter yixingensis]|uniref:relaxase/mobilization nuclease domain-containing protein n=1 Tax=Mucilaginibacter yixingensis TaxID=1295612 RepID=UPI001FEA5A07|nr:relaxase/mobilization nuclease domain-containing protein [Mucilaginibacter yixingensis]